MSICYLESIRRTREHIPFVTMFQLILLFFKLITAEEPKCSMRGLCEGDYGEAPCAYTGPPMLLRGDDPHLLKANISLSKLLNETCPQYSTHDKLCCDEAQLLDIRNALDLLSTLGFARCPSCDENMRQIVCISTCSPHQGQSIRVLESREDGSKRRAAVKLVVVISDKFIHSVYESCQGIKGFIPGTYLFDYGLCGSWGRARCNHQRWFEFMGSTPDNGGYSPTKVKYVFSNSNVLEDGYTLRPLTGPTKRCFESPGTGIGPCSCSDCEEACIDLRLPELPPQPKPFTIASVDGFAIIAAVSFSAVVALVIIFLQIRIRKKEQKSATETVSLWLRPKYPALPSEVNGINLGSLEEVHPLRSKLKYQVPDGLSNGQSEKTTLVKLGYRFEKALANVFEAWAGFVSRRTKTVMVVALIIALPFAVMAFFRFEVTIDPIALWVSRDSQARIEREYFNKHFEPFYRIHQVIVKPTIKDFFNHSINLDNQWTSVSFGPIFRKEFLMATLQMKESIENLTARRKNSMISLRDICVAPLTPLNNECAVISLFGFFQNRKDIFHNESAYLSHFMSCSRSPHEEKCFAKYGGPVERTELVVGGFEGSDYHKARALVITILSRNYYDVEKNLDSEYWEKRFLSFMKNFSHPLLEVSFKAERSIEDEIYRSSQSDALMVSICYLLMFCYLTFALGEYHHFRTLLLDSKFMLGFFGVNIVLLSIISSFGLCSLLGSPTTLIVLEVVPFMVLAVGVDNIFILVQTYQRENRRSDLQLEKQIKIVVGKVGPSMLLSTVSMSSCFLIGATSEMPAVHLFALCAGIAIIVNLFLQMTIFLGLFILDCRRRENHLLDVCCCIEVSEDKNLSNKMQKKEGFIFKVFKNLYAPFLMKDSVRCVVGLTFLAWFCSSIAVIHKIHIGLEFHLSVPKDSYMIKYFDDTNEYLSVGPPVYFVLTSGFNYTDKKAQNKVCSSHSFCDMNSLTSQLGLMAKVKNRTYIAFQPISWMDSYFEFLKSESCCFKFIKNGTHCPSTFALDHKDVCTSCRSSDPADLSEHDFVERLSFFLSDAPWKRCIKGGKAQFGTAVELLQENNETRIGATSFMTYHTVLKTSEDYYESLRWSREISENLTIAMNSTARVFAYSILHVFYEQYLTIWRDTLVSLGLSILAVFIATLMVTGIDVYSSVFITFTVLATVVDLMALMYWWNISLNAISLVNIVVAVGISVEFCSHVTRSFAMSTKPTLKLRAQEALSQMGTSVLSGITLTDCGILVLAFAKSQIFQVFYFRMYLGTIVFGTLHGLVLLPVLLSLFGAS